MIYGEKERDRERERESWKRKSNKASTPWTRKVAKR
jgi:hypothetical protein